MGIGASLLLVCCIELSIGKLLFDLICITLCACVILLSTNRYFSHCEIYQKTKLALGQVMLKNITCKYSIAITYFTDDNSVHEDDAKLFGDSDGNSCAPLLIKRSCHTFHDDQIDDKEVESDY